MTAPRPVGSASRTGATAPVTLVGHLTYYHHAAAALHGAGLLARYFTLGSASRALPGAHLPAVGRAVSRFNQTRVFPGLAELPVSRLWAAQLAGESVRRTLERKDPGRGLAARNALWDLEARARIGHPEILHIVEGIARGPARRVRRAGGFVVLDVRSAHPSYWRAVVGPHLDRQGIPWQMPVEPILDRVLTEHDLADLLVCNSSYTRRSFLEAGFDPSRVVAVDLGCDTSRFRPAERGPDRFTVLFAGRDRWQKGFADLAAAARALPDDARLVVTGRREPRDERFLTGVRAEVVYLDDIPADAMPDIYRSASVLALPSLSDGFGLVVVEAMASGLPVVVSDRTGAADAVEEGENGYVVTAGAVDELADRLQLLAKDPDLVARLGARARSTSAAYSWSAYGERLRRVYETSVIPSVPSR